MKIENLTSAAARKALAVATTRLTEVDERLKAIRGPLKIAVEVPAGHRPPDPLKSIGPVYRAALETGTPAELIALETESAELEAERSQLHHRRDLLTARAKAAEEEEARAAAPAVAKRLLAKLPDVMDRVDELKAELADVLEEQATMLRELDAARALTDGAPFYPPELLRRTWLSDAARVTPTLLRASLSTNTKPLNPMVPTLTGGSMVRPAYTMDCRHKLAPPEGGLLEKLRSRVGSPRVRQGRDEALLDELATVRAKILAAGEFDQLSEAVDAAREARSGRGRRAG